MGEKEIQATFYRALPPRLSCCCFYCSGLPHTAFGEEPKIIATDGKFVLLRITIGSMPSIFDWHYNYFIYQTDGAPDGGPSLQLLPRPIRPNVFYDEQVGLLSHGTGYTVVALRDDRSAFFHLSSGPGEFDVYLLHSEDRVWTTKAVTVPPEQQRKSNRAFQHFTHKVITVGGEAGTMAFVDLQHGILLYEVFTGDNLLRYTRVSQQKFLHRVLDDGSTVCDINAATTRDITIVDGWFKFVEVATIMKKASGIHTKYVADWKVTTWCMDAISLQDASWLPGDEVQSAGIGFDYNTLLPNQLPLDEESPLLHLERLVIDHLMHSLNADVVYVMAKIDWQNPDTWVIAVDMSCGQLKGTTKLGAERTRGSRLIYTSGRISQHLFSGTKNEVKRPAGLPLLGSYNKKHHGIPVDHVASIGAEDEDDRN